VADVAALAAKYLKEKSNEIVKISMYDIAIEREDSAKIQSTARS